MGQYPAAACEQVLGALLVTAWHILGHWWAYAQGLHPPLRLPAALRPAMIRLNGLAEHQLTKVPPITHSPTAHTHVSARYLAHLQCL